MASLFLAQAMAWGQGDSAWRLSGSVAYSEGDYGTGDKSRVTYVPVTATRFLPRGYVSATLSAVSVDTSGQESESGMGDTLLKVALYALDGTPTQPGVDLVAKVKIPTADDNKGLGTGAVDFGGGTEAYQWFHYPWVGFMDVYVMAIGDSAATDKSTQQIGDIGLGHQTTAAWLNSLFLEYRSAIAPSQDDSVSTYYLGSYRFGPEAKVFGSLEIGLTDGAPDYAVSLGLSLYFR